MTKPSYEELENELEQFRNLTYVRNFECREAILKAELAHQKANVAEMHRDCMKAESRVRELESLPTEWEGSGYSPQQMGRLVLQYRERQADVRTLSAELARVRGLLQRYGKHDEGCTWSKGLCSQLECYEMHETACTCGLAQGAESADIGKLDTVDKSGKVKGEYMDKLLLQQKLNEGYMAGLLFAEHAPDKDAITAERMRILTLPLVEMGKVNRVDEKASAKCPQCNGELEKVRNTSPYLNDDQAASQRAGDYFCNKCPDNDRGHSGLCYWWEREVMVKAGSAETGGEPAAGVINVTPEGPSDES